MTGVLDLQLEDIRSNSTNLRSDAPNNSLSMVFVASIRRQLVKQLSRWQFCVCLSVDNLGNEFLMTIAPSWIL